MSEETKIYDCPIGNYYGGPYVREEDGKYIFGIENWDGDIETEVSRAFYDAFRSEFEGRQQHNIATAPDLLEALEALVNAADRHEWIEQTELSADGLGPALNAAHAALAKATEGA